MKKSLIALAALAAVGAASAQSSVTLYGVIDANYGWTRDTLKIGSNKIEKTTVGLNPGYNLSSSRWGLKGQEDLGNGLSAVFNVEAGFNSTTGAFTSGFSRRAVVGLKGGFGQVLVGKDWTPIDGIASDYQAVDEVTGDKVGGAIVNEALGIVAPAPYSALLGTTSLYTAQVEGLHYSGNFSGVNVQAFAGHNKTEYEANNVGFGESKTEGAGIGLGYANGPFAINGAVAYFRGSAQNTYNFASTYDDDYVTTRSLEAALGASYDFGPAKLMGHYIYKKPKLGFGEHGVTYGTLSLKAIQQLGVGVSVPFGAATVGVQYAYNRMSLPAGLSSRLEGHDFAAQGTYALSKRTSLYARAGRVNAWKLKGTSVKAYSDFALVGVRHQF